MSVDPALTALFFFVFLRALRGELLFLVSYNGYRRETKRGPSRHSKDMLKLSAHEIPQP
jgi:hypothetical protein